MTKSTMGIQTDAASRRLPRILCLHGGGSNARIFRAQCRALRAELAGQFRLVFAEAPLDSEPGPDVTSVYREFGPFRRWLRSKPEHEHIDAREATELIEDALYDAMDQDDLQGATGDWVGLMGFSQGAKVAASLLFRQQVRSQRLGKFLAGSSFKFAVLMAGRGPLVSLEPELLMNSALIDASEIGLPRPPKPRDIAKKEHVLRLPTIHVHGVTDPGLPLHRTLLRDYCSSDARLVEWDGNHRVPIKTKDVSRVVDQIMAVARKAGI